MNPSSDATSVSNPLPLGPIPGKPQIYTGGKIISDEELEAAAQEDKYTRQLMKYLADDEALAIKIREELRDAYVKILRPLRAKLRAVNLRRMNRRRQVKQVKAILRVRLAHEKIKKLREDIFK